eukprot:GILI01006925.1.p1 GENE.GILI01006925.1~~GILI01006925.1.p1  ORF type:complete len:820 (-),score=293.42 GILI01006925.1:31-2424(-)
MSVPGTTTEVIEQDDQEKWVEEATTVVKQQAFFMRRALDNVNLREALKHSSNMICELRTSLLSPKNYYELYMLVFSELGYLEAFFKDEHKRGRRMIDLYESVQHAGNILPRLYLLITVGSVYIQSKEAPAKQILKDLIELSKGVQHPMRGLFLRYYLCQMSKNKLPDKGSDYEGEGGDVKDAVDFILQNFAEMNKLWVRLQHQGPIKDKTRREAERLDLRVLVGDNLVRLSQLDGLDLPMYSSVVLPKLLEQVVACKDQIAQQYLMDCIVQVFPDEFHLYTLEAYLEACTQLQPGVDLLTILMNFMKRLSAYASHSPIPQEINVFDIFQGYIGKLIDQQTDMPVSNLLSLQVSFLGFTLSFYPGNLEYVDNLLGRTVTLLAKLSNKNLDAASVSHVVSLLSVPLESLGMAILGMSHFPKLMEYLQWNTRKTVALKLAQAVVSLKTALTSVEQVETLLSFIRPLVKDEEEGGKGEEEESDGSIEAEQTHVVKVLYLLQAGSTDDHFRMLQIFRKHLKEGGSKRIKHTMVPLVFAALTLARRIRALERADRDAGAESSGRAISTRKVFQFVHEIATALVTHHPETSFRLFLQCAQAASEADIEGDYENIAYEFIAQALIVYEDDISDSKAQFAALSLVMGTLCTVKCLGFENYDTLITKATQYGAKLLKKPDQCRAVYLCSHLFWNNEAAGYREGKRVLECLQRSLKIADICMQSSSSNVTLLVEILNQYLYYFDQQNEFVTDFVGKMLALTEENLRGIDTSDPASAAALKFMQNTLAHIKIKRDSPNGERWTALSASA